MSTCQSLRAIPLGQPAFSLSESFPDRNKHVYLSKYAQDCSVNLWHDLAPLCVKSSCYLVEQHEFVYMFLNVLMSIFSVFSLSPDHCVHYYDLRNTKQPIMVFKGHRKAVSYAKFVSGEEIVSA